MVTLVIATATAACSVALIERDRVVARAHVVVGRGHVERLIPMIGALPDGGRAAAILVDCGPGSFTGVRVGLAAARGLGIGWEVPVRGFSSLALLAAQAFASCDDATLVAVLDGGHGEVFAQRFDRALTPLDAMASYPPAAAIARFAGMRFVGQGTARLAQVDPAIAIDTLLPDAGAAILLPDALATLPPAPLYGRAPDAVPSMGA